MLGFFASVPACLVGLEACASAHYWARELQALGHKVRLIPPHYVKPFVRTSKNDATDAGAIWEALVATVDDARQFRSAHQFAAWLGLVPRQKLTGGKNRLGRISKRGDGYLRRLLVHGARIVLFWSRRKKETRPDWLEALLARRPTNVVLVAMANKTARVVWAMLTRNETFQPDRQAVAKTTSRPTKNCEGDNDLMAKQGDRDRPNPRRCQSLELDSLTGRRSTDSIRASGQHNPHTEAG